jgi:WD40 repeat protein
VEVTTFWSLPAGTSEWQIPKASNGVVFGPERDTIVIGEPGTVEKAGADSVLAWWERGQKEASHSVPLEWFVGRMATSADHARLATSDAEMARVWDVRTGHELRQMAYSGWLTAVAISPDGRYLASTGRDVDLDTLIEVTEIWPDDLVAALCARLHRNLTHNEWREYLGESEPYRKTCPDVTEEPSEP